jgi:ABC-type dipeptide/oligopeptide/nickel transport system permease component
LTTIRAREATTEQPAPASARPRREFARYRKVVVSRARFVVFQLLAVLILVFLLVRLAPGNPAVLLAGAYPTPQVVAQITKNLGLDKPLPEQFWIYLKQIVLHGNLGTSTTTSRPVTQDLINRLPATLELITIVTIVCVGLGVLLGAFAARHGRSLFGRIVRGYAMLGGALPDFWIGLLLIYVFVGVAHVAPTPLGQLGTTPPPPNITGSYLVDSFFTGHWTAFWSAVSHLILPVTALVLATMSQFVRLTWVSVSEADSAEFVELYEGLGVSRKVVRRRAARVAMKPVITIAGVVYGFLLGGAVLVEKVFAWGGIGQYAVDAVGHSDYAALQGFVLVAAMFNIIVYLIVDLAVMWIDPRVGRIA